jgi:hypothetical protein
VVAYPVVTTPATTVRGVAADITKKTTLGTPRRLAARVLDSGPAALVDVDKGMRGPPGVRGYAR